MSVVVEEARSFKCLDDTEYAVTGWVLWGILKLNASSRPLDAKLPTLWGKKNLKSIK